VNTVLSSCGNLLVEAPWSWTNQRR